MCRLFKSCVCGCIFVGVCICEYSLLCVYACACVGLSVSVCVYMVCVFRFLSEYVCVRA